MPVQREELLGRHTLMRHGIEVAVGIAPYVCRVTYLEPYRFPLDALYKGELESRS